MVVGLGYLPQSEVFGQRYYKLVLELNFVTEVVRTYFDLRLRFGFQNFQAVVDNDHCLFVFVQVSQYLDASSFRCSLDKQGDNGDVDFLVVIGYLVVGLNNRLYFQSVALVGYRQTCLRLAGWGKTATSLLVVCTSSHRKRMRFSNLVIENPFGENLNFTNYFKT